MSRQESIRVAKLTLKNFEKVGNNRMAIRYREVIDKYEAQTDAEYEAMVVANNAARTPAQKAAIASMAAEFFRKAR